MTKEGVARNPTVAGLSAAGYRERTEEERTMVVNRTICALISIIMSVGTMAGFGQTNPTPLVTAPQRSPDFLPLGVYWPGECTFQEYQIPKMRWAKIDAALDGMASNHVNTVWLTHLSSADTAEFSRRAAKRGIYVVASLAELAGEVEWVRKGDNKTLIENTLKSWGDAPKPIAWGLGDEPRGDYKGEMAQYVKAWRQYAPAEPVTCTVMWNDVAAIGQIGFDALCADVYPFFSGGNPNGYGMPPSAAWSQITENVARQPGGRPWMMGQGYQEPWGPYELDEKGNIVYLPGGAPHWVMPTPAEIKWQAWGAFASGAKGMFYFLYRWPLTANPKAEAAKLPAAVKERTNSGSPRALVYDDGRPTVQYTAMGEAYGRIAALAPLLAKLRPAVAPEAWPESGVDQGSMARVFVEPKSGRRYLFVVASYEGTNASVRVPVMLGPHILGLKPVSGGAAIAVETAAPFRRAAIELPPGEGALLECTVDPDNLPQAYADDFATDKFKRDTVNGADARNVMLYPSAAGTWLTAAGGGTSADQAFLIYDLEKLFGPAPAGALRMLLYSGSANPAAYRGAFWSASDDGKTFASLSDNQFDKSIIFTQRYLKVGLSWMGATAPHYGHVSKLNLFQWKKPAVATRD